jgi:4-oxalocrotonate tautomerase
MAFPSVAPGSSFIRSLIAEDRAMQNAYAEIAAVLSTYFDGLYHSDTKRLRSVFHPRAQYVCATDGTLTYRTMEEYFPIVDERPSPASRGEARADSIVSIEFAGPVTAFARVNCAIGPKYFTDLLTLIRLDGRWQIISKVFHFELEAAA